ncbi:hypothetical protein QF117_19255 [Vibrio sp. YMD68]|nr:hypothetical protein [Vibrio sp. YMD68]WGW00009.1 hypothetical protein QF117_19255 [Vibrio sp. YMD68]
MNTIIHITAQAIATLLTVYFTIKLVALVFGVKAAELVWQAMNDILIF